MAHADYLWRMMNPVNRRKTVNKVAKYLKRLSAEGLLDFDNIAVRGESGAGIGYPVAYKLDIPITICRKEPLTSHSKRPTEYIHGVRKAVILDDFMSSGDTVAIIKNQLIVERIKPVAVVLYSEWSSNPMTPFKNHRLDGIPVYYLGVSHTALNN